MTVRLVEGEKPYTGGTAIEITSNKVVNLLLRSENNLLHVNDDNELYCDLQLENGLAPTDDFPVGVTVGIVNANDGRSQNGLLLHYETTSGAYAQWLYGADGKLYFDGGTGTFKQVYYADEVNTLLLNLRNYVDQQLALKENKSNKTDDYTQNNQTNYPSSKALKEGLDTKVDKSTTANQIYATSPTGTQRTISDKAIAVYYIDGLNGNDADDGGELTPYQTWSAFMTAHGTENNIIVKICNLDSTSIALTDKQNWTICRTGTGSNALTAFTNSGCDHLRLIGLNITTYSESGEAYYNLVENCTLGDMTLNMTGNNQTINEIRKCETGNITLTSGKYIFTSTYGGSKRNNDERIIIQNGGTLVLSNCGGYGVQRAGGTITVKDGTELTRVAGLGNGTYCLISNDSAGYVYLLDGKSNDPINLGGTASYTLGKFVFDKDNSTLAGTNLDEVLSAKQMVDTQQFEAINPDSARQEDINKALDHQIQVIINGGYAPTGRDRGLVLNAYTGELCYQLTSIQINNAGSGYAPGDVLFLEGLDVDDTYLLGWAIVETVGSSGELMSVIIDQKGAFATDQSQVGMNTSTNGSGTGATVNIITTAGTGTTTNNIGNAIPGDVVTVLRNEMTSNYGTWQFVYADKDGDGNYEWTPSRPITTGQLQGDNSTIQINNGIIALTQGIKDKINQSVYTISDQVINGVKTFVISPVVPSKSADAGNNPTTISTEAQVYKKIDKVTGGTANNLTALTNDGQVADSGIAKNHVELNTNKETGDTLSDDTTKYPSSHTVKKAVDSKQGTLTAGNNISIVNDVISATDTITTKIFTLTSTSDYTTAKAVYDWYIDNKNPIVIYNDRVYTVNGYQPDDGSGQVLLGLVSTLEELTSTITGTTNFGAYRLIFESIDSGVTFSTITNNTVSISTLVAGLNYPTAYTPQYDGSPATKKYVDDNVVQKSSSEPSVPVAGMIWWDTTNDLLKYYDGNNWITIGVGNGDMAYANFNFNTASSGATLTISNLSTNFTPNQNFSIAHGTLKEGMQYIVRINTGATAYTMSLGTGVTNPFGEDLTLTASKTTTLVFLATSSSTLELFSARTAS